MADEDKGGPDGATVDSQGGLWEAQAGNWRVVRHRPSDGAIDYEIKLPFNNPTSVAIGDPHNSTLYITTARHRLNDEERLQQPGAGQLWAVQLPKPLKGLAEPLFKGRRGTQFKGTVPYRESKEAMQEEAASGVSLPRSLRLPLSSPLAPVPRCSRCACCAAHLVFLALAVLLSPPPYDPSITPDFAGNRPLSTVNDLHFLLG
jgi:hypothetical protein